MVPAMLVWLLDKVLIDWGLTILFSCCTEGQWLWHYKSQSIKLIQKVGIAVFEIYYVFS